MQAWSAVAVQSPQRDLGGGAPTQTQPRYFWDPAAFLQVAQRTRDVGSCAWLWCPGASRPPRTPPGGSGPYPHMVPGAGRARGAGRRPGNIWGGESGSPGWVRRGREAPPEPYEGGARSRGHRLGEWVNAPGHFFFKRFLAGNRQFGGQIRSPREKSARGPTFEPNRNYLNQFRGIL